MRSYDTILHNDFRQFTPIKDAPKWETAQKWTPAQWEEEAAKQYVAINEKGVWLVRNPVFMTLQCARGATVITRPPPKQIAKIDDGRVIPIEDDRAPTQAAPNMGWNL